MIISQNHFEKIYKENHIDVTCLVVIINDDCNCECKACIARQVFKSPLCKEICEAYETCSVLRCCGHTATDEEFYERLERVLQTITSPVVDIIISGGEPTISERLIPTLEIIDKYHYQEKSLQFETNGAHLAKPEIVEALTKRNVKIHLSRYSVNDTDNESEFKYHFAPVTAANVENLVELYGDNLGISTVLLKKYIGSGQALLDFVDYYKDFGIKRFSFLEFMADTSLRSQNKELLEYYDEQRIPIEQLADELKTAGAECVGEVTDGAFRMVMFTYRGTEFALTASDLSIQKNQETSNSISRFLIMPSGEIGVNGIEKR